MADYVTAAQVGYFAHEWDASHARAALLITSASRLFDNLCEVREDFFAIASGTESDRTFVGDGTAYLKLDPYVSLALTDPVMINEGTIDEADFVSDNVPDYAEQNGMLVVLSRTTRHQFSPTGINRYVGWPDGKQIEVTADWGFAAIPKDIVTACAHLAIHLWRTGDPAFATISNAEGAASRAITIPEIAQTTVEKYREMYSRKALFT